MSILDFIAVFLWLAPAYVLAGVASLIIATERASTPWRGKDFSDVKLWLAILLRRGYKGAIFSLYTGPQGDLSDFLNTFVKREIMA